MEDLALHRVSNPRFMAIDVPMEPPRGVRRMICPIDSSLEELTARHVLETGQRDRILAGFDYEHAWRTKNGLSNQPAVIYSSGGRGDIEARAEFNPQRSIEMAVQSKPDAAIVQVILDASGVDEEYIQWLLDDRYYTFVYLVTSPETARHLPKEIEHAGTKVQIRCFPWIREPDPDPFDPLATSVWFYLAGPDITLRRSVRADEPASFKRRTEPPKESGS